MSFLQPFLLVALPIAALPIIIHLINQRRYQSVRWAAMMFLLAANRMSRGYARLRQYLILAMRVLAIAALIFVISRPLTGGWLGRAGGGRPDTTLLLIDRSPSMRQLGAGTVDSKLDTGKRQLAEALEAIGSARWVLVEAGTNKAREVEKVGDLLATPAAEPTGASSDLPGMLAAARDYVRDNKAGRTEVYILSDLREGDWNADGGRWQGLRDSFAGLAQSVRFHLLAYPKGDPGNLSVRVTDARRRKAGDAAEAVVSLVVTREGGVEGTTRVPIGFEVDGARSELTVDMSGPRYELKDHKIPIPASRERGWGRVTIPADGNPADNDAWFAFSPPAPRKAIVVADDPQAALPLQIAASVSPDPTIPCSAEVVAPEALAAADWDSAALLLWQAPLPEGNDAKVVQEFIGRGGRAVFLPPRSPTAAEFLGVTWTSWGDAKEDVPIENWRSDQDLLANTLSGAPLPVGALQVHKHCVLRGEVTPLATLKGGAPWLARKPTDSGGAYFLATTPAPADSSLASGGVVFYVMIQRALAAGAEVLASTRQVAAGDPPAGSPSTWKRLAGSEDAVSTDYPLHPGVYQVGEKLLAVNRPTSEDAAPILEDAKVAGLFKGLDFSRVDDQAGNASSLIQEVWRVFLASMMVAMMAEAGLCLPKKPPKVPGETA